jgi:butyryl-CoA dehydrogenase
MDFRLTEEQQLIQKSARDFAQKEVAPKARSLDAEGRWPSELVARMGELGFLGIAVPDELGGGGADHVSYALAMIEISKACASTGVIMSVNNSLVCDPLWKFGNDAQKKEFLAPLASGAKLGCFGLTEPASGSDASNMDTVAVRDGDEWVINGSKNWITNGPHADVIVVFCCTDRSQGARGTSAFIVPKGTPGFNPQPRDHKLGIHAAHSCTIFFEDCRVPDAYRLGDVGMGFKIAMSTLDGGRIGIASQALGIATCAYDAAVAHLRATPADQGEQFRLADMATRIEAARDLALRAASMKERGEPFSREASIAKAFATEGAWATCNTAVEIVGDDALTLGHPAERALRDVRVTMIYEGTSEVQRVVVSRLELR